jgi:hypothetical protein
MIGVLPVLAGMPVLGGVTASHRAAGETGPKMDPTVPEIDTLLAHGGCGLRRHQADEVLTGLISVRDSPPTPKLAVPKPFWRGDLTL